MREGSNSAATRLLRWYDSHARDLPWRVSPADIRRGVLPDPYIVWLSEIMLQQTTVAAVRPYFERFIRRWPDVHRLAGADDAEVMAAWAGLGYYARARNILKCARIVSRELEGRFPDAEPALRALPGIGRYTAAAIAAIAFGHRAVVVDGNVERVVARYFGVQEALPGCKKTLHGLAAGLTPAKRAGDYAQAMMDLGAAVCTNSSPACGRCPIASCCEALATGQQNELPRREVKDAKPVRNGIIYFAEREDGALFLETRPPKGLLGGMTGFPTSDWVEGEPVDQPPFAADWRELRGEVRHTFTHFHLVLKIHRASDCAGGSSRCGSFVAQDAKTIAALPTVMRKAHILARGAA